jgi:hypothetical protein
METPMTKRELIELLVERTDIPDDALIFAYDIDGRRNGVTDIDHDAERNHAEFVTAD